MNINMRIDEQGHIEVESEGDYNKGVIDDCAFTSDPKQIIYTKDLVTCVGLALVEKLSNENLKRGLMHIYYSGKAGYKKTKKSVYNPKGINLVLKRKEKTRVIRSLEKFLHNFEKEPRAFLVYVRYKGDVNGFENPMARYIYNWLLDKGVGIYFSEASGNKNKEKSYLYMDPDIVHHKNFSIHHNKIAIMHMGTPIGQYKNGIWLNKNLTDFPLDLNL